MSMSFFNQTDEERLKSYKKMYEKDNMSWGAIAKQLGTYTNKVRRDATKLGIESRDKSDAQKIAIAKGRHEHPTKGKKRSIETKIKISESQGKVWDNLTDQEREYRSEIARQAWENKTDEEREEIFKKSTQAIQEASRKGSKIEREVAEFLEEQGFVVERHKECMLKNDKFHVDIYIPECRTAIEIDGIMHFEPIFGEDRLEKRQAADSMKNGLILSSGMAIIRVKLTKRLSQRYMRNICSEVLEILNRLKNNFPKQLSKRQFEV